MFSRGHEIDDGTEEAGNLFESNVSIRVVATTGHACKHTPLHIILYCVVGVSDRDEKVIMISLVVKDLKIFNYSFYSILAASILS